LRLIFVVVILLSSITSLIQATGATGLSPNGGVAVLASVEIAAIIALAIEPSRGWAAIVLLIVFAVAFVGSAFEREFAVRFIYFAASTIYLQGVEGRFSPGQLPE
jgi:hypothetical protein